MEAEREARKKERMEKEMRELRTSLEARHSEIKAKQQQVGGRVYWMFWRRWAGWAGGGMCGWTGVSKWGINAGRGGASHAAQSSAPSKQLAVEG